MVSEATSTRGAKMDTQTLDITVIADNGGGYTLQLVDAQGNRYQHSYDDSKQIATDIRTVEETGTFADWEDNTVKPVRTITLTDMTAELESELRWVEERDGNLWAGWEALNEDYPNATVEVYELEDYGTSRVYCVRGGSDDGTDWALLSSQGEPLLVDWWKSPSYDDIRNGGCRVLSPAELRMINLEDESWRNVQQLAEALQVHAS